MNAQSVLTAALGAGFRESGAINISNPTLSQGQPSKDILPMVAVRTMGLALDCIIGYLEEEPDGQEGRIWTYFPPGYLQQLLRIANGRFEENAKRIEKFREGLGVRFGYVPPSKAAGKVTVANPVVGEDDEPEIVAVESKEWEDANLRRERKKREGLARREALRQQQELEELQAASEVSEFQQPQSPEEDRVAVETMPETHKSEKQKLMEAAMLLQGVPGDF
jgi:tRNA wybutosine-synthesizing protein 3